ncbi:carbohydrate kinase [Allokutzneria sp. A3M-2-11 16]|nr:carbohydrate kinase [Allokutzneria sp. A3M-2-11 16]
MTKAVVVDAATGEEISSAEARVPELTPRPGWFERDMDAVWNGCAEAIRKAIAPVGGDSVAAVGLCGHNDGCYPVDAAFRPVRNAILATDSRAESYVDRHDARALALTGQVPFAASPAALQKWLRDNEPDVVERARWLLFCKDWLRLRLTGVVATDPTEASASFTDVHTQRWSPAAFEHYGLAELADRHPPILDSAAVAGTVTAEAAALTGLRVGTLVATGAHDVDAAALGLGAITPGAVSIVMGTFSINQVVADHPHTDHRWQARAFLQAGRWLAMSTSAASASNLEWFAKTLWPGVLAVLEEEVAASTTEDLPIYLPFLRGSPDGSRPSGTFLGLRAHHTRGDLLRALLEGVVLNHRTHLDALRSAFPFHGAARVAGGGTRSPLWTQMLADGVNMAVEVTNGAEPGARGAALLAGISTGHYASLGEAVSTVRVVRTHEPSPPEVVRMRARSARYHSAVDALSSWWNE